MIEKFDEYCQKLNESYEEADDIDARENIDSRSPGKSITVSTEIDPGHEVHPTISVYFPKLFMYIDLDKIDVKDYQDLHSTTVIRIGTIVQDLDTQLDIELKTCIENMQKKLIDAAKEIHSLTGITSKRYGL